MAQLTFDPKLGEQAAEAMSSVLNGDLPNSIAAAYETGKHAGEDNPIVEAISVKCTGYETMFNEQLLPAMQVVHDFAMGYAELAASVNRLDVAQTKGPEDFGHVEANNYDAAKVL